MINPFVWLLVLCIAMLVGSFLSGCIPLSTKLSDAKLRHLTAFGVGLLIGTALVVIIPEGVETMYNATSIRSSGIHPEAGVNMVKSPLALDSHQGSAAWKGENGDALRTSELTHLGKRDPHTHEEDQDSSGHFAIGASLITGFALMFIVDQLSSLHLHASHGEFNELNTIQPESPTTSDLAEGDSVHRTYHLRPSARSMTPTIGLIVHATADGIALGASASQPKLSMVVFIAIMLHKAPSAFALTTVLLAEGLSRINVRRHLLLFSLAAPSGAIITYLLLNVFSSASESTAGGQLAYWTGVLLIFSGGTFLYVAMHALQELQPSVPTSPSSLAHPDKLSGSQVASILGGMFLPILLNVKHSH